MSGIPDLVWIQTECLNGMTEQTSTNGQWTDDLNTYVCKQRSFLTGGKALSLTVKTLRKGNAEY